MNLVEALSHPERSSPPIARFGPFEVDLETGELSNQGQKLPLQTKPFQLLAALLDRPGQLVTREELRQKIWPEGTYVDFGRSLNIAVAKLRRTLSDLADKPVYVETLPKRGYRFIAPIEGKDQRSQFPFRSPSGSTEPFAPGLAQVSSPGHLSPGPGPLLRNREGTPQRSIQIAVLPFETYCDTEEQAHFSEDLADEICAQVEQFCPRQVGIITPTGNLQQNGAKSICQVGRDLKADHVLTGSVRIAGGHVEIAARLTSVAEQTASWAERFSSTVGDALKIRIEAATKIARSIGAELVPFSSDAAAEHTTPHKDAYLEYLKGQQCHSRFTSIGFRRSIQHFERAIFLDPNYAPAYCGLACSKAGLGSVVFSGGQPKDFYPQAKAAALRAIELNNKIPNGHTALAIVKMYYEWDWSAGERLVSRALELDPTDSFAHQVYSRLLASMRRHDEAIDQAKRNCQLQPLSAHAHYLLGEAFYGARQFDKALEAFKEALDLDEMHGAAMMGAGIAYSQQLRFDEATSVLEWASTVHADNTTILASLGETYARAGRLEKARNILNKLKALSRQQYVSPFDFALITTGLGRKDHAIEYLERAYQETCPLLVKFLLPENPRLDVLRDDPRYIDLVQRIREHSPKFGMRE